jgi:hypothetical protein
LRGTHPRGGSAPLTADVRPDFEDRNKGNIWG